MAGEGRPVMAAADGPPPGMSWARRLLWRVWPDRNPLRRGADRLERALLVVLFALFAAGIPAAALAVAHWAGIGAAHAARVAALASEAAGRLNAKAQLLRAQADLGRVDDLVKDGSISVR